MEKEVQMKIRNDEKGYTITRLNNSTRGQITKGIEDSMKESLLKTEQALNELQDEIIKQHIGRAPTQETFFRIKRNQNAIISKYNLPNEFRGDGYTKVYSYNELDEETQKLSKIFVLKYNCFCPCTDMSILKVEGD